MEKQRLFCAAYCLGTTLLLGGGLVSCSEGGNAPEGDSQPTPYITKVLEFVPAPGQFVNALPAFSEGDSQETMNQKVLELIGHNKRGLVSLGGYGGYVIVGFDHTIENKAGKPDFRVLGNAFNGNSSAAASGKAQGGSYEPGIIRVAYDKNKNGRPDSDEWFEIQGSAHKAGHTEAWYEEAKEAGNDMHFYSDYEITYYRPSGEPSSAEDKERYIRWTDNKGGEGYLPKNVYHNQPYFPQWVTAGRITFRGARLPQNAVNKGTEDQPYFVLFPFSQGYADNAINDSEGACIDIDWAIDAAGQPADLPGVDFIQIYTGVNQINGWLGECSTEVMGVEDLHLLGK